MMTNPVLWVARTIWSLPLGVAGALKLADPRAFQEDILDFGILPVPAAGVVAVVVPWLELCCALGAWWTRIAAGARWWAALCLGVFTVWNAVAWWQGLEQSCGCFGDLPVPLWAMTLIDVVLLIGVIIDHRMVSRRDPSG